MHIFKFLPFSVFVVCSLLSIESRAQYHFTGELNTDYAGNSIYLSLIEDYRKINRIYLDQILLKSMVDSTGQFEFQGDNLYEDNRIYRIHIDNCGELSSADHFRLGA